MNNLLLEKFKNGEIKKLQIEDMDSNSIEVLKEVILKAIGSNDKIEEIIEVKKESNICEDKISNEKKHADEELELVDLKTVKTRLPNTAKGLRCTECGQALLFKVSDQTGEMSYVMYNHGKLYKVPEKVSFEGVEFDKYNYNNTEIYDDILTIIGSTPPVMVFADKGIKAECPICNNVDNTFALSNHYNNTAGDFCHTCGSTLDHKVSNSKHKYSSPCVNECKYF